MPDTLTIYCKNTGTYVPVEGGESLFSIYSRLRDQINPAGDPVLDPVCALVNNKNEGLSFNVFQPRQVEFLNRFTSSGSRTYIRSLCMVLYRAVSKLFPAARLCIEHSISRGYYCRLRNIPSLSKDELNEIKDEMRSLVERDLRFERKEKLTADVIKIFEAQGLKDKVTLLRTIRQLYTTYYTLDGICDSYYGVLAYSTGCLRAFDLRLYKEGFLLYGFDPDSQADKIPAFVNQEKMYRAFTDYLEFNHIIGIHSVGELNEAVLNRDTASLINVAEALHDKMISRISDEITRRYRQGGARIVLVAGPSSSGKTTTTKRLEIHLLANLMKPQTISLDDYFVDRTTTPRDENGDYDYESLYALDLKQFNKDLNLILQGAEVELPSYNFERGQRVYKGKKIKLEENGVLLIEGIHGLNPELTANIEEAMKYRVYVSALTTISIDDHNWIPTTDNRLIRRIIRDYKYRGASAEDTIRRWPSVRKGEEKWIFPYQENADATFNSSLLFELGVMKERGEEILSQVPQDVPEYAEAYRLRKFLSYFLPVNISSIPSTSLLREFLGGSSFRY